MAPPGSHLAIFMEVGPVGSCDSAICLLDMYLKETALKETANFSLRAVSLISIENGVSAVNLKLVDIHGRVSEAALGSILKHMENALGMCIC